jgi:hypothetical protein
MKRPRKTAPRIDRLEPRRLLSLAGTWLGQDGHDLTGPSVVAAPSGVQDVHIALTGLPAERTVRSIELLGLGGGAWVYGEGWGWAAPFVRSGATTGELFFEPYQVETGRPFDVRVRYDDGSTDETWVTGGAADPAVRMPGDSVQIAWIGQDGPDKVGRGPAVGPDGIQDVHLALTNLTRTVPIEAVRIDGPPGIAWAAGRNPEGVWNAQLDRHGDDPTRAELWLNPDRDLAGQDLTLTVVYSTGVIDTAVVTAGTSDPGLAVAPAPAPPARIAGVVGAWVGQDGLDLTGPGDVHLSVENLPAGRAIASAVLSDAAGVLWVYQAPGVPAPFADPFPGPLAVQVSGTRADLAFPPARDETGSTLTLRLNFDDGTIAVVPIAGGAADLSLRAPGPDSSSITARPGDDLNDLANRFGTVRLAAGQYDLNQPLVLAHPVTITADAGAVLNFTQPADATPWTAAIKVHAANTTLDGFAVRFGGPVRWDWDVPYGPAVIGTTDDRDHRENLVKVNLAFTNLDIQGPPVAAPAGLEPSPGLFRLVTAHSGRIVGNTFQGGTIEVVGGPWTISGNDYRGAVPGTSVATFLAGHFTHDLVVTDNHAEPRGPTGKAWRFLVLTQAGYRDRVEGNRVVGIGPRDDDTVPNPNATEIVLTEAYRLRFEGWPLAVSPDGRVLQIPEPQGGPAQAGDVVAILDGPAAGQWRRVAQAIDARTYLLDAPLPANTGAISIGAAFVEETFRGNTIDARGSSLAADMMLAGAHYGTRVVENRLVGGRYALLARSGPSESPVEWGWSHTPQFGLTIEGNTLVDADEGSVVGVEHGPPIKTTKHRVYFSGRVARNTFGFSPEFLAAHPGALPRALTIGEVGSLDPAEQRVTWEANLARGSAATVLVHAGSVNGRIELDSRTTLPLTTLPAPAPPRLVRDTGWSGSDRLTSDGRLTFAAVAGAVGYEYRVGSSGPFVSLAASGPFLPAGLVEGRNTVTVRAIDEYGVRGPAATASFVIDTTPPPALDGLRLAMPTGPTLRFLPTGPRDLYEYRVGPGGTYRTLGLLTAFIPSGLAYGPNTVGVRARDLAGNVGPEATLSVDVAPPAAVLSGLWMGQDGSDLVGPSRTAAPDGTRDIHLALRGLRPDVSLASVVVSGLGGGIWAMNGTVDAWAAAVVQAPGGPVAHVYIQPYQQETGRPYHVEIRYSDGTTADTWIAGGWVDPSLRAVVPSTTTPGTPTPAGTLTPLAGAARNVVIMPRWRRAALRASGLRWWER